MHVARAVPLSLLSLAALALGGCDSTASTRPTALEEPALLDLPVDFALRAPVPTRQELDGGTSVSLPPPVDSERPPSVGGVNTRPLQQIWEVHSNLSFLGNTVELLSRQSYIGNVGAMESTITLHEDGKHFLTRTSPAQEYTPFIYDFGRVKRMFHSNRIDLQSTCGLTAYGWTQHQAWWQFFQGRAAPLWGVVERPSSAKSVRGPCGDRTGERGGTIEEEGGRVCTVLITYDLDTNEILNVEVLSCYNISDNRM